MTRTGVFHQTSPSAHGMGRPLRCPVWSSTTPPPPLGAHVRGGFVPHTKWSIATTRGIGTLRAVITVMCQP